MKHKPSRRVITAGAAASIVLTVSPALVAPSGAAAAPAARASRSLPVSGVAVQASQTADKAAAKAAFQTSQRAARAALVNSVTAAHAAYAAALESGTARWQARITLDASLATAHDIFLARAEAARVGYLQGAGASAEAIAATKYRQSVRNATAAYRRAVAAARAQFRLATADEQAALTREVAASADHAERSLAREKFRQAVYDDSETFRTLALAARMHYRSDLAAAKSALQAAAAQKAAAA